MDGILKVTNDIYNKFCTLVDKNWDELQKLLKIILMLATR